MKPMALVCVCLFALTSAVGCGGGAEPVTEEAATENESVDTQLESSGVSEQDYEKEMQEAQNAAQEESQL